MLKPLLTGLLLTTGISAMAQPCIQNTSSLNFGGSASVTFSTDNNLQIANSITVEAWIYPTTFASLPDQGTIVCHHSWTQGGEQGYVLRAGGSGQVAFNIAGVTSSGTNMGWTFASSTTNAIPLNTWSHVAGTFDGTNIRVYVNGIQVGITAFTGTINPPTAYSIAIGKLSDTGVAASRFWSGRIDEVRVWNRALISAELQNKRNTHLTASNEVGLVGYWRFNENTGTAVADSSASGNNGTLSGANFTLNVPFNQSAATPLIIPNGNTLTSTLASSYQWYVNNQQILGATTQTWVATQSGSYTVIITDSLGCYGTSTPYIVTLAGVDELSDGNSFSVKKINNSLSIEVIRAGNMKSVRMIDMNGKVIRYEQVQGTSKWDMSLNSVAPGCYIVDVTTDNAVGRTRIMIE